MFLHVSRYVIDNSTDFESKLQRLVNLVAKLVGLPTNLSRRSAKYLLSQRPNPDLFPANIDYHTFQVEKVCVCHVLPVCFGFALVSYLNPLNFFLDYHRPCRFTWWSQIAKKRDRIDSFAREQL